MNNFDDLIKDIRDNNQFFIKLQGNDPLDLMDADNVGYPGEEDEPEVCSCGRVENGAIARQELGYE